MEPLKVFLIRTWTRKDRQLRLISNMKSIDITKQVRGLLAPWNLKGVGFQEPATVSSLLHIWKRWQVLEPDDLDKKLGGDASSASGWKIGFEHYTDMHWYAVKTRRFATGCFHAAISIDKAGKTISKILPEGQHRNQGNAVVIDWIGSAALGYWGTESCNLLLWQLDFSKIASKSHPSEFFHSQELAFSWQNNSRQRFEFIHAYNRIHRYLAYLTTFNSFDINLEKITNHNALVIVSLLAGVPSNQYMVLKIPDFVFLSKRPGICIEYPTALLFFERSSRITLVECNWHLQNEPQFGLIVSLCLLSWDCQSNVRVMTWLVHHPILPMKLKPAKTKVTTFGFRIRKLQVAMIELQWPEEKLSARVFYSLFKSKFSLLMVNGYPFHQLPAELGTPLRFWNIQLKTTYWITDPREAGALNGPVIIHKIRYKTQ